MVTILEQTGGLLRNPSMEIDGTLAKEPMRKRACVWAYYIPNASSITWVSMRLRLVLVRGFTTQRDRGECLLSPVAPLKKDDTRLLDIPPWNFYPP